MLVNHFSIILKMLIKASSLVSWFVWCSGLDLICQTLPLVRGTPGSWHGKSCKLPFCYFPWSGCSLISPKIFRGTSPISVTYLLTLRVQIMIICLLFIAIIIKGIEPRWNQSMIPACWAGSTHVIPRSCKSPLFPPKYSTFPLCPFSFLSFLFSLPRKHLFPSISFFITTVHL